MAISATNLPLYQEKPIYLAAPFPHTLWRSLSSPVTTLEGPDGSTVSLKNLLFRVAQLKLLPDVHISRLFLEMIPLVTSVLTGLISLAQGSWCFLSLFISKCSEVEITRIILTFRGLLFLSVHWGVCACSVVSDFVTPWTEAIQVLLFKEFSRQKYWSGLPFPSPGDLPNTGIEPASPALPGEFFTTSTWEALCPLDVNIIIGDPEETGWDDWEIQALDGRWTLTAFIQAGKLLLGMLRLAATGMGLLSATFYQRGVCYSPYYISNTLSCILVVISHQMNRGFPWNKSTDGYLLRVILVSKSCWILQHFPKLLCVCVCVYSGSLGKLSTAGCF